MSAQRHSNSELWKLRGAVLGRLPASDFMDLDCKSYSGIWSWEEIGIASKSSLSMTTRSCGQV